MGKKERTQTVGRPHGGLLPSFPGLLFMRNGRYYYRNREEGINDVSLRTNDLAVAHDVLHRQYGYLLNPQRRIAPVIPLVMVTRGKVVSTRTVAPEPVLPVQAPAASDEERLALKDVLNAYEEVLVLTQKRGRLHVDANTLIPLAPATVEITRNIYRRFHDWLTRNYPNLEYMDEVTPRIAEAYFIDIKKKGIIGQRFSRKRHRGQKQKPVTLIPIQPGTYNRYLVQLRVMWKRLSIKAGIDSNPFDRISRINSVEVAAMAKQRRAFTKDELRIMIEKAEGWIRPAIFIGYYSGLRLGDVVTLHWDEVDMNEGFIMRRARKTSKDQMLYVPEAIPEIKAWREKSFNPEEEFKQFLFPELATAYLGLGMVRDKRCKKVQRKPDKCRPSKLFQDFLKSVLNLNKEDGKIGMGFHCLRGTHATYCRTSGMNLKDIQQQLGHSDERTTMGYIKQSEEENKNFLRAHHMALPQLGTDMKNDSPEVVELKSKILSLQAKTSEEMLAMVEEMIRTSKPTQG